jgi:hypothetical protein
MLIIHLAINWEKIFHHKKLFMKQNQLSTAFNLIASALVFTLAIASCNKKSSEFKLASSTDEIASAKPATIQTVSLKVTANDAAANNLTSDGGGDYVNGSQSVSATFDQYGNFIFNCGLGGHGNNTYMIRWFNFDFSQPIQIFIAPPVSTSERGLSMTTGFVAAYTFIPLQNLAVGQSECVGLTTGISGNSWTVNFHRTAEDVSSSPSAYAVFTRINSTQWTVSPVGSCSPNSNVCALRNGPGTLYGYYNMPFSLTLTKL